MSTMHKVLGTYTFIIHQAGINHNQLCIDLEPQVASIHCQYLPTEKLKGASGGFTMGGAGQQYMVIDLGGTVYIRMIYIETLFETNHYYSTKHTIVHSLQEDIENKY